MQKPSPLHTFLRISLVFIPLAATVFAFVISSPATPEQSASVTYARDTVSASIPYHATEHGPGRLRIEILNPEDRVLGHIEKSLTLSEGYGQWKERITLKQTLSLQDLAWQRLRYRFDFDNQNTAPIEGTEALSQILRTPILHIIGQQSYLAGSQAAVRIIVTDSAQQPILGTGSVHIELLGGKAAPRKLFTGVLNHRGTTEAQFRLPADLTGDFQLHYAVETPIGSTEFTQAVRLQEKDSILLTTEKPLYQPGQTIHVRALALNRANHNAVAEKDLLLELEDSRGNKVFKKATHTDSFGIASAEFTLADEVNIGTYHLHASLGPNSSPGNAAELALNVQKYVLPKFKVSLDFSSKETKARHGYRPGDHVTGEIHANYFFGKPLVAAGVSMKASAMDVSLSEAASTECKTDQEGACHFDLTLPNYFAGRPSTQGAARVLVEATVKDAAGHLETRGEPITVTESALLITAVPEGGNLIPKLENRVFFLATYPDGTPAPSEMTVNLSNGSSQHLSTDPGGIAVARVRTTAGTETFQIQAKDTEGNSANTRIVLPSRPGTDQILLRMDRAVYRPGDPIHLQILSTQQRGTAYLDVVKDSQTMFTRDIDIENGQAEITLPASPDMAGTIDFSAYLFSRDAQVVGDHRLAFVQPADELKIVTTPDSASYKPGDDACIRFRVTDSHGRGVRAALGLQIVDEAVFALAEKQPGFAKVFFYLEQEVMKPRYEIHSIGMPEVVESVEAAKAQQHDRAAQALFSATEMVSSNKFETEYGRNLVNEKAGEYNTRYLARFQQQAAGLASVLQESYAKNPTEGDLKKVFDRLQSEGKKESSDPWGNNMRLEPAYYHDQSKSFYVLRSAGPDKRFDTGDDFVTYLQIHRRKIIGPASQGLSMINLNLEHDRGSFTFHAQITGKVLDQWGAAVEGAQIKLRQASNGRMRNFTVSADGEFHFSGLPEDDYMFAVASGSESLRQNFKLVARDRAALTVFLRHQPSADVQSLGSAGQFDVKKEKAVIEVSAAAPVMDTGMAFGNAVGAVSETVALERRRDEKSLPMNGRNFTQLALLSPGVAKDASAPATHVRSYFPEALYINPEIITDGKGDASITVPLADNITTWRMAMLASTEHGALGSSTSSLKVFQDFFVDLDLPVTLTQGDQVSLPVAIYNYSGAKGGVSLQLQPADWYSLVSDSSEKSVTAEPTGVSGSQFTLQANRIGKFKLTLSAKMNGDVNRADIVVREIEVVPNGREQNLVFNGRFDSSLIQEVAFPPQSIPDARKLFVRIYPGPLSQVVEGMDAILRMPGGCFEQTSSSTYPNVLALAYMKRSKKLTPEVHAKAEGYIANGYQRLLTFEVPGGGFSWFGQAPANKILTAYGLMEFYDMSQVYNVDPNLISRTQQWLAGQQQSDGSWKPDANFINEGATNRYNSDLLRITAYLAWSLENTNYQGPAVASARAYIQKHLSGKLDSYTLAVLANFAADGNDQDRNFTRQIMQLLLEAGLEKDDQVSWSAEETSVYSTGSSASIETTGLAVQALLKWGQASQPTRKALAFIASKKDSSGTWGSTQATIMALRALLLATEKGSSDVRGDVQIAINGKLQSKLQLTAENNDLYQQFVFKDLDGKGPNSVEIRFDGKGTLACQIVGQYFLPWDEKPESDPLSIAVKYDRTQLAQDDIVSAVATVRNNLDKPANMVMVDLGIPPGFDLLTEDLQEYLEKSAPRKNGRLQKFSTTATQAILYFDSFAPGETVSLHFRLRAKYPIRARTFSSRVYEYYDPQISSLAKPIALEVRKR
jgi:uncharacterized protein YfaS (alpha-2-macroglobulin family)